jgi:ribosomal protein L37E
VYKVRKEKWCGYGRNKKPRSERWIYKNISYSRIKFSNNKLKI